MKRTAAGSVIEQKGACSRMDPLRTNKLRTDTTGLANNSDVFVCTVERQLLTTGSMGQEHMGTVLVKFPCRWIQVAFSIITENERVGTFTADPLLKIQQETLYIENSTFDRQNSCLPSLCCP